MKLSRNYVYVFLYTSNQHPTYMCNVITEMSVCNCWLCTGGGLVRSEMTKIATQWRSKQRDTVRMGGIESSPIKLWAVWIYLVWVEWVRGTGGTRHPGLETIQGRQGGQQCCKLQWDLERPLNGTPEHYISRNLDGRFVWNIKIKRRRKKSLGGRVMLWQFIRSRMDVIESVWS